MAHAPLCVNIYINIVTCNAGFTTVRTIISNIILTLLTGADKIGQMLTMLQQHIHKILRKSRSLNFTRIDRVTFRIYPKILFTMYTFDGDSYDSENMQVIHFKIMR